MQLLAAPIAFIGGCSDFGAEDAVEPEHVGITQQALYTPPDCDVTCQTNGTLAAMNAAAIKYGFPRWFIYATAHRESTFRQGAVSGSGSEDCSVGYGLMQLTCAFHDGVVYPNNLQTPNQSYSAWLADSRINPFCSETGLCPWINMNDVSALPTEGDRLVAAKNLDRYFSGYAAPAYYLERARAPQLQSESTYDYHNRILRRVAWHWRYGHYTSTGCACGTCAFSYDTDPCGYFTGADPYRWDYYVNIYRPNVEAEDGIWDGNACRPPYSSSGCASSSTPTFSSSATAAPTCRVAGSGAVTIDADYVNTNNTAYESMLGIEVWSGSTEISEAYTQRTFGAGTTQEFIWNWPVPTSVSAPAQTYTIKLGCGSFASIPRRGVSVT
jgi:hypothetical protein